MFLFIFESIGTSELILIGIIALIVLGPRKLPQMAKTIGKTMADFRQTTNDFKSTWEREVNFEEEKKAEQITASSNENLAIVENTVEREQSIIGERKDSVNAPEIKEVEYKSFSQPLSENENTIAEETKTEKEETSKRDWL